MNTLTHPKLLYLKGGLFLVCGCLAGGLLVAQQPTLVNALLLTVTVWAFCRCYYFMFYVIEHYIDDRYRFAGIADFLAYCLPRSWPLTQSRADARKRSTVAQERCTHTAQKLQSETLTGASSSRTRSNMTTMAASTATTNTTMTRWEDCVAKTLQVIDSHTGGEPTRLIVSGGPNLGSGTLMERREKLRREFDHVRRGCILEPRGSDVLVGGLLCEPHDSSCTAGVIFFNNTGYLNMCGHGTIGLMVTLAHMGRVTDGVHRIETPVGVVTTELLNEHEVSVCNVPSWRHLSGVTISVADHGPVTGDIAWGGNWFFLCEDHGQILEASDWASLTQFCSRIRESLEANGITGADGGVIDHIELVGPPSEAATADRRSFVLCPGGAYDRSPCGTGTSAKMACLAADDRLQPGQKWRQESIIGTVFEGWYDLAEEHAITQSASPVIVPSITGSAWVTAESTLLMSDDDPFAHGIVT